MAGEGYDFQAPYNQWLFLVPVKGGRDFFYPYHPLQEPEKSDTTWYLHSLKSNSPETTPPKTNMEPKNEGLEDVSPFQMGDFQVPC